MSASPSTSQLLNAVYVSSQEGASILSALTKKAGFSAENVVSRLAIARSLLAPAGSWDERLTVDSNGKQIKGFTLLGRQEIASALLAMIIESEDEQVTLDDLRRLVRLHWERGLRLMSSDLGPRDFAELLVDYSQKSMLSGGASTQEAAASASKAIGSAFVGQHELKKALRGLIQAAEQTDPVRFRDAVFLVGPRGMGQTKVAWALSAALHLPLVELGTGALANANATLLALERQLAAHGYTKEEPRPGYFRYPPCVVYVRVEGQSDLLMALRPSRTYSSLGGSHVCVSGGALIVSGREKPIGQGHELPMSPYTREEVAEILRRAIGSWPLEMRRLLAVAGRLNPSDAVAKANEYFSIAKALGPGAGPSESHLLGVMHEKWGVDGLGLLPSDYAYLQVLPSRGADSEAGHDVVDFLERLGLIRRAAQEVALTERGRLALEAHQT